MYIVYDFLLACLFEPRCRKTAVIVFGNSNGSDEAVLGCSLTRSFAVHLVRHGSSGKFNERLAVRTELYFLAPC